MLNLHDLEVYHSNIYITQNSDELNKYNLIYVWKLNFVFHLFFVKLIDFVYLIKITFLEYLYSVIVLTSNIARPVATAAQA